MDIEQPSTSYRLISADAPRRPNLSTPYGAILTRAAESGRRLAHPSSAPASSYSNVRHGLGVRHPAYSIRRKKRGREARGARAGWFCAPRVDTEERPISLLGLRWFGCLATVRRSRLRPETSEDTGADAAGVLDGRVSDAYSPSGARRCTMRGRADFGSRWQRVSTTAEQQAADDSWHVATRLYPRRRSARRTSRRLPYGHDQFLSAQAGAWAS